MLNENVQVRTSFRPHLTCLFLDKFPYYILTSFDYVETHKTVEQAVMAEWLRRWTWNPMGSPRAGSNPARSDIFIFLFPSTIIISSSISVIDIIINSRPTLFFLCIIFF